MLNLLKKVKLNYEDKKKVFSLLVIEHAFQELVLHRGLALRRGKRNTFRTATEDDEDGTAKNAYNQAESSWYFKYFFAKLKKIRLKTLQRSKFRVITTLTGHFLVP